MQSHAPRSPSVYLLGRGGYWQGVSEGEALLSTITDWLTVLFTGTSSATPFLLYRLQANTNLPLVEAKAERAMISDQKNSVKITLIFSNKLDETLSITDMMCRKPKNKKIMPVHYIQRDDGRFAGIILMDTHDKFNFPCKIIRLGAGSIYSSSTNKIEFYILPLPDDLREVKISFRISSSARTLKRRRFAIPIKITEDAANAPD